MLRVAEAGMASGDLFSYATLAIKVVADDSILARLAEAADRAGQLSYSVFSQLATLLYPKHWTALKLVKMLAVTNANTTQRRQWSYSLRDHLRE